MNNIKYMQDKKQIIISVGVVVAVIALVMLFALFNKPAVKLGFYEGLLSLERISELSTCPLTADKDAFAKCITEKGWTMYGAAWCPHCQDQKALFGESFKYAQYVECPDNIQLCTDKKVNGYPTWIVEK